MMPRVFQESVWCARFLWCGAIGDPGYTGGSHAELCVACEQERISDLARAGEIPEPNPEPNGEADESHESH